MDPNHSWGTRRNRYTSRNTVHIRRLRVNARRDTDAPVLTRMENLRRATIYAQQDPAVARQLLDAVVARVQTTRNAGPQADFDAGYLIESYKQAAFMRGRKDAPGWRAVDSAIDL